MKKKLQYILFSFLVGITVFSARAQQDSQFTQYMYNTSRFNPAYAGSRETLSFVGLYRSQWVGLEGAPTTLDFSISSPLGEQGVGLGLEFTSDRIGATTESRIAADFSYTIFLSRYTKLALGVKGGFSLMDVDTNKLLIYDPSDYDLARKNYSAPIIGAGAFLYANNWYVGLSTPNFLETKHYDEVKVSTATEKTHLYLTGGYIFELSDVFKLKPALLVKGVMGAPLSLDLSANTLLYGKVTLGLAYRLDSAVSGLAGFQVNDFILLGYAYDYETTELSSYNSGSHEVFLRFELVSRKNSKVNPRFF